MTDKEYYCTVANDGVAVCVCKYKPCEQLKRKEQECEEYKTLAKQHLADFFKKEQECENLKEDYAELEKRHNDSFEQFKNLKMICGDYKIALDAIEEFIKNQLDGFGNAVYSMDKSAINNIQNIINKAKDGE